MSRLAALVLAAGESRRFGSDKRLARLPDGRALLDATLALYIEAIGDCFAVVDEADSALRGRIPALGAECVTLCGARSGRSAAGMGDSLAAGVARIADAGYAGCVVALGDMPRIAPQTVRRVADALSHHPLVVPVWRGQWGHPVGFGAQFFPQLRALQGARGALGVLQGNEARRCELPVEDEGVLLDVDVPDDLLRLGGARRLARSGRKMQCKPL